MPCWPKLPRTKATASAPIQTVTPNRRVRCDHSAHASSAHKPRKYVLSSLAWTLAAKRHTARYGYETFMPRGEGKGRPSFSARFQRRRKIGESVVQGISWRGLYAWAATNRKKNMGSQRNTAAAVRALAIPALVCVEGVGFCRNRLKRAGPPLS